jgi:signal transduction histidine kinase
VRPTFEALSSFDQINLGSTFLQAVVTLSFAAVQVGVARHFDRPAMRALSTLWQLFAIAAIPNLLSSWAGAMWGNKELSRALNTIELAVVQRQSAALVAAEARIASGERMESLGRLAAGVAHDFNNVLQVIRLATGSLRTTVNRPDDVVVLDEINSASKHGAALVSQLLTFARQQPQDPQRFDALDRLRSLTPMLHRVAGPDAEFDVTVTDGAAIVIMEPSQFEQIAINLVSNARDAVGRDGRIGVALDVVRLASNDMRTGLTDAGDYVRLTVTDNGHGIPDSIRGRIFDPFFTTKETGQGAGLGLAMVHGIVSRAGGAVTVDSALGSGSTFAVYLPVLERTATTRGGDSRSKGSHASPVELAAVG